MSDPAEEARARAWHYRADHNWDDKTSGLAAAREALAPIRELHRPNTDEHADTIIDCPRCITGPDHAIECAECWDPWPCDTARLIYTSEELS